MVAPLHAVQPLTNRNRNSRCETFSRDCGKLVGKPVRLVVFYIETH
jgi:hypothetical protein